MEQIVIALLILGLFFVMTRWIFRINKIVSALEEMLIIMKTGRDEFRQEMECVSAILKKK